MPTFSKLRRNIFNKNYLIKDLLVSFLLALLSSQFIYFPLLIGLVISTKMRLTFVLPFLFWTTITHHFGYFSLIFFFILYRLYIYPILSTKLDKNIIGHFSIILVYLLYFAMLNSIDIMNDIPFHLNYIYIVYYILLEELILFIKRLYFG